MTFSAEEVRIARINVLIGADIRHIVADMLGAFAAMLEQHEAVTDEPVAWRVDWPSWRQYHDRDDNPLPESWESPPPRVTPLYTAPPASGDWDAVREVIATLNADGDEWGCAAKLTAALPESKP